MSRLEVTPQAVTRPLFFLFFFIFLHRDSVVRYRTISYQGQLSYTPT